MSSANDIPDDILNDDATDSGAAVSASIERMIVRKLDGELTGEASVALDRELLRCPQARAMFEAYSRNDALAGPVIRSAANCAEAPITAAFETEYSARGGRHEFESIRFDRHGTARRHRWMWAASAVAACLAMAMFWHTPAERAGNGAGIVDGDTARDPVRKSHAPIPRVGVPGGEVGVFNAADIAPHPVNRQTDRNYYFVPNTRDGRIYLFSVDRIRETEQPKIIGAESRRWDPI